MKHTPGPWKERYVKNYGRIVEVTEGKLADVMVRGTCGDESEANAKLIAAAPELLEACLEILTARNYVLENGGDLLTTCSWAKLEKVIRKAKGE